MKLPTYDECYEKADHVQPMTPVETFLYDYSPVDDEDDFRAELQAVVSAAHAAGFAEAREAAAQFFEQPDSPHTVWSDFEVADAIRALQSKDER